MMGVSGASEADWTGKGRAGLAQGCKQETEGWKEGKQVGEGLTEASRSERKREEGNVQPQSTGSCRFPDICPSAQHASFVITHLKNGQRC